MMSNTESERRFQCDLQALDATQRKRRAELASKIWPQNSETRELATGYEFRFEFSPSLVSDIAEMAVLERLCCPFFDLGIMLGKNMGPIWLKITGDPGVKQFIKAEMNF